MIGTALPFLSMFPSVDWAGLFGYEPTEPLIFTRFFFWGFFAVVLAIYSVVYKHRATRNAYLFLVSLFFYFKTSGLFVFILLFSTVSDYVLAIAIHNAVPGLRFGGGVYLDDIPANNDAGAGSVHGELDETIYNLYCVYEDLSWEALGEYFLIDHQGTGTDADSGGWYLQVGRHYGDWTPYVRLDGAHRDDQDPYWASTEDTETESQ